MSNIKSIFEKLGLFEGNDDILDELESSSSLTNNNLHNADDVGDEPLDAFLKGEDSTDNQIVNFSDAENNDALEDKSIDALFTQSDIENDFAPENITNSSTSIDNLTSESSLDEQLFSNITNDQDTSDEMILTLINDIEQNSNSHDDIMQSDDENDIRHDDIMQSDDENDIRHDDIMQSDDENDIHHDNIMQSDDENDIHHDNIMQSDDENDIHHDNIMQSDDEDDINIDQLFESDTITSSEIISSNITTEDLAHIDQDTHLNSAKEIIMLEENQKNNDDSFTLESSDLLSNFIDENSDESHTNKTSEPISEKDNDTIETVDEMLQELNELNHSLDNTNDTSVEPYNLTNKHSGESLEAIEEKLDRMIESYDRNKLMSVEDIYKKSLLDMELQSTIFMVEVYAKALPQNLPLDVKRESVINIMKASNINVVDMLSDAYTRIDTLNKFLENVVDTTQELKEKNTNTINDLEKRIANLKRLTRERENFQEEQNTMIEYEIQRIINVVDFIKEK